MRKHFKQFIASVLAVLLMVSPPTLYLKANAYDYSVSITLGSKTTYKGIDAWYVYLDGSYAAGSGSWSSGTSSGGYSARIKSTTGDECLLSVAAEDNAGHDIALIVCFPTLQQGVTINPSFYYEGGGTNGTTAGHGSYSSFSVGSSKTNTVTVTGTYVSGPTITRFDTRCWSPYSYMPDYRCYTLGMQAASNQQVYQGTHKICYEISTDRTNWYIVSGSSSYVVQYTGNVGEYVEGLGLPSSINPQQAAGKTLYMRACDVLDGVKSTSYTAIKSITLGTPLDTPVLNSCTRVSSSQLAVSYEKVPNAKLYIIEYSRNRTFTDKKIITV